MPSPPSEPKAVSPSTMEGFLSERALWGNDPATRPYGLDAGLGPKPGSLPISVTIITLNEEANIRQCLAAVAFAAEVIVVDAESRDRTVELARAAGAETFVRPWPGYTAQRKFSLEQCSHPWVLCVDADVRVSLALAHSLEKVLRTEPAHSAYRLPELNLYFGRWLRHGGIYPGHHIRFFDRRVHAYETGPADVHEDVFAPDSGVLEGHLLHLAYPNFRLALGKLNNYTDLEAKGRHARGIKSNALQLVRRPLGRFFSNYVRKRGFLDGMQGFLYCFLTALYAFTITVKLWELEQNEKRKPA